MTPVILNNFFNKQFSLYILCYNNLFINVKLCKKLVQFAHHIKVKIKST